MDAAGVGKIITISQAVFEGMIRFPKNCNDTYPMPGGCKCDEDEECKSGYCYISEGEFQDQAMILVTYFSMVA
jgi:voltage-dependent calcium channel alpha-2/delta-3